MTRDERRGEFRVASKSTVTQCVFPVLLLFNSVVQLQSTTMGCQMKTSASVMCGGFSSGFSRNESHFVEQIWLGQLER
jgi:hypothetical protein